MSSWQRLTLYCFQMAIGLDLSSERVNFGLFMLTTSLHELIPVLQVAIGPVILISGVGLLLLTLTNRFRRAIDRFCASWRWEMRDLTGPEQARLARQVKNSLSARRLDPGGRGDGGGLCAAGGGTH